MEEAITALLAHVAGGQRYWVRAPQKAKPPFLVLQRISGQRDYHSQGPSGLVTSRVQVDCYAATYTAAKTLARETTQALSGHRGDELQGVFLDGERDLPAEDAGAVNHLYRVSLDFITTHLET